MKLINLLEVLCKEDFVGIWNMEYPVSTKRKYKRPFEEYPTQQKYFKVKNIPYGRIQYFMNYDVYAINHTSKGLLVRIGKMDKTHEELERRTLAYEIGKEIENRIKGI